MRWNIAAILGAIALVLLVGAFSGNARIVMQPSAPATQASLGVVPQVTLPPIVLPPIGGEATTSPKDTAPPSVGSEAHPSPSAPATSAQTPTSQPVQSEDFSASADALRTALVNILCIVPSGSGYQSISGSGVIVSASGMILTNSHVAQYFLLANKGVSCEVRSGSPAVPVYRAALAFISPVWIAANPNVLNEQSPSGTGEYDFALLAIDGSANNSPLPTSFPFVPLATTSPSIGQEIVIGSYAAQFLKTSSIESALDATIVYGSINNVFTFATSSIDVVSLGGSAAAQEGSSGGGVINGNGDLVATITTSTTEGDTSTRNLNAITESYIRREYAVETGSSLSSLLSESPTLAISNFAPQIPALEATITANTQK